MGAPISEFMVEQLLRTGLEIVRNQPSKLDDLYGRLNEGVFAQFYGKKVIDQVKDYIFNRRIAIVQSLQQVPDTAPCFSIIIVGSQEDSPRAVLDDFDSRVDTPTKLQALATFAIQSYQSVTGFISVDDAVNLSSLYIGANIVDSNNVSFEIVGPIINEAGRKGFYVVPDATVTIGTVTLYDAFAIQSVGRRTLPIMDHVQIGVHAKDNINLTKYLYYLILYIFHTRRLELENAGYQLHRINASDLIREEDLLPSNITSRYLNIQMLTWFEWTDDPWQLANDSRNKILVDRAVWHKDDDTNVGTT